MNDSKQRFITSIKEAVTENFNRDGNLVPVVLYRAEKGELCCYISECDGTEESKDELAATIMRIRTFSPLVAYVCEAWTLKVNKEDFDKPMVMPSKSPNREENVIISFYFGLNESMVISAKINRDDSVPFLEEWSEPFPNVAGRYHQQTVSSN